MSANKSSTIEVLSSVTKINGRHRNT